MPLQLANYQQQAQEAIKAFWTGRDNAMQRQALAGNADAGARGAVTAGKNLDGFRALIVELVRANGLPNAQILFSKGQVVLPGYFRPTKQWDMLIKNGRHLVAALEFKSQVGPSFGNNFNNRSEEAIGTAHCLWTAYREGAFGRDQLRPFLGWLMIVEDCPASNVPVRNDSPHFAVDRAYSGTSYLQRYDLLCQRLVTEQLYHSTALLATPREQGTSVGFSRSLSQLSSLDTFVTNFAAHIAAEAARNAQPPALFGRT